MQLENRIFYIINFQNTYLIAPEKYKYIFAPSLFQKMSQYYISLAKENFV